MKKLLSIITLIGLTSSVCYAGVTFSATNTYMNNYSDSAMTPSMRSEKRISKKVTPIKSDKKKIEKNQLNNIYENQNYVRNEDIDVVKSFKSK